MLKEELNAITTAMRVLDDESKAKFTHALMYNLETLAINKLRKTRLVLSKSK